MFNYISHISLSKILTSGTGVVYNTVYGIDFTVEIGFALLNKLISMFTINPQWLLLICALITNILIGRFIIQNTDNVFFALYIYMCESMYMHSFNAMRQFLAIAIAIQAYDLIKNKRYFCGMVIILLACCFHTSALVMFGLFPMMMFRNQKKAIKYMFAGAVLVVFSVPLMQYIIDSFFPNYSVYFKVNYWGVSVRGQALLWFAELIICAFLLFRRNNEKLNQDNCYIAISGTLLYLALEIIGLRISIFQRVALYYNIFIIFLFVCFAHEFREKKHVIINTGLLFVMTVAFLRTASIPARLYHFFWQ